MKHIKLFEQFINEATNVTNDKIEAVFREYQKTHKNKIDDFIDMYQDRNLKYAAMKWTQDILNWKGSRALVKELDNETVKRGFLKIVIEELEGGEDRTIFEAASLVDEKTGKTVKLPYKTKNFRGDPVTVVGFTEPHKSSSSGRIETSDGGSYFPGVAGLKIVGHKFESSVVNEEDTYITEKKFDADKFWARHGKKMMKWVDDNEEIIPDLFFDNNYNLVGMDGSTKDLALSIVYQMGDESALLRLMNESIQDDALALIKTDKKLQSAIKKATQSASERDWNQVWKRYDELGIDTNTEDFEGFDIEVVDAFDKL